MTTGTNTEKTVQLEIKLENDLQDLADALGFSYESTRTHDEIIAAIAEELEAQIDDAETNPQALSTLMGYYHQLNNLDALLDEIRQEEDNFNSFMNMPTNTGREEFGF